MEISKNVNNPKKSVARRGCNPRGKARRHLCAREENYFLSKSTRAITSAVAERL